MLFRRLDSFGEKAMADIELIKQKKKERMEKVVFAQKHRKFRKRTCALAKRQVRRRP